MQEISYINYSNLQQINKTVEQFISKFPEIEITLAKCRKDSSYNIYNRYKRKYYKQNAGKIAHRVFSM